MTIEQKRKAEKLLKLLDFDNCIELFDKLPAGHPMIDLIFARMEEIDAVRFDNWL